ncbi:hypothetical protein [Qipengyuania marisflavi]|uniref:Multidrug resistance protein NorM n=1 Tax=Qipengyuania marisflavi TaxID=2486356 RepID=A0A5S3P8M1_9SPHN|nr:hypothetical protein [Qipengyuania marisflavi]TMM47340.1 hypothetical protein FEV51_09745 [Qipengyuania marisflavi]
MTNPDHRRLARGTLAFLFGIVSRVAAQLAMLPILFASWSAERVGSWMVLFALPAYLSVVGLAFSGAGGNAALAAAQRGDMADARANFRVTWALSTVATLALAGLFLALALPFEDRIVDGFEMTSDIALLPTLFWLAVYIFAVSQIAVLSLPFRVAGRYPLQTLLINLGLLAEVAVVAVCVSQSTSLALLAMALAIMRLVYLLVVLVIAIRIAPEMFHRGASRIGPVVRSLWKPSTAFMLIPVVYAINLQGYALLVGARYGAAMLAAFVATRTLVRMIDLLTSVIYGVQFYEAGYRDADPEPRRRQLATMTLITALLSVGFGAALLMCGPLAQRLLSVGKTEFDLPVAAVLMMAAIIRALATTPHALIAAQNRQGRLTVLYFAGSVFCLLAAGGLAHIGVPLVLVLLMLIPAELVHTVPAFRIVLRDIALTPGQFLASLFIRERMSDIAKLARIISRPR